MYLSLQTCSPDPVLEVDAFPRSITRKEITECGPPSSPLMISPYSRVGGYCKGVLENCNATRWLRGSTVT